MKDILRYTIWTGIYGVLIIPFIVANDMFFPFITGKAFTFRIIVEIIFCLWLILILKDKESRPKWSWIFGTAGIFTLVMFIADSFAVAPFKAFWSNFERMEGWVTLIHLLMFLLVLGSVFPTKKIWFWFLRASVIFSAIMGYLAVSEIIRTGVDRVAGPLGNPIYISHYFLFNFFFILFLFYWDILSKLESWKEIKNIFKNWLLYAYLLVGVISVYLVYKTSRGVLLGLIGGLFITMIVMAIGERKRIFLKQSAIVGIIAIITVVVGFFFVRDTNFVKNNPTLSRFAEISWSNINGQARQLVWPMALSGFKEKPLLGWGQDGFNYVFNKYYDAKMYNQEQWFDRAHNTTLDYLVAGGILGLLSYLALFVATLYLLWFRKNNFDITEKGLITGLLAGYYFQSMFVFDNLVSYLFFFVTLAYVHSRVVEENNNEDVIVVSNRKDFKKVDDSISSLFDNEEYQNYIFIPTISILMIASIWLVNIPAIKANMTLIQSLRLVQSGRILESINGFKLALSYKSLGDSEIREQLVVYAPAVLNASGIDQKTKMDFLTLTATELEKQIESVPNDARYYILMGSLFNAIGSPDQAIPYIQKAIELSPQKQTMRFELIRAYLALNKTEEAMKEAKTTYELEKSDEEAKNIYMGTVKNAIYLDPKFRSEGEKILIDLGF